ncbi:MAG: Fe-S cluster assembly protein SufD [Anaerolineales bacterium]|nr:Fe-S cluster assembly protein SufD [Anaerolineales bacterium]
MTTQVLPTVDSAAPAPKYQRAVITTNRKVNEPPPAALTVSKAAVQARSRALGDAAWYARRRLAALKVFDAQPMPTLTDEAWRRTDIRPFKWGEAALGLTGAAAANGKAQRVPAGLLKPLAGSEQGGQLVVVGDEVTTASLHAALKRQKVIFTDFLTATKKHADLLKKYLGKTVAIGEGKFAALAEALADGGVFVYVPKGVQAALPLHSVAWVTGQAHFSRVVIVVDDGASATVVHEIASPDSTPGQPLHVGTVEVLVGKKAHLTFVELQSLGRNVWNFTHERTRVKADGKADWIFSAVGSHLTKNFSEIDLDGAGSTGKMSGFYFADGEQHLDHDTQQNHNAPHTTSDLLFKGALRDKGHSVWQGMIYVAPGAQKADGYQANRNLVLNRGARADSIPGLEILADDVRCTHGATVGQLEAEHIFYLMSRGITRADAERLVVDGFFDPILQRIPFEGVRQRLKRSIEAKMGG